MLPTLGRLGEVERVERALAGFEEQERDEPQIRIALAWVRLEAGDPQAATVALEPMLGAAGPVLANAWDSLHAWLIEAIARDALGEADAARRALERALDLAEPDGALAPFVLHPVPDLLERHRRAGTAHAALVSDILDILFGVRSVRASAEPGRLLEPLTDSEMRVLRYLPTNLTVPEIAGELYLSVNTVRTHTRHLYAKLSAHDRSEAVEQARALGMLAPSRVGPSQGSARR